MRKNHILNKVYLRGTVKEAPTFYYETMKDEYYRMVIGVKRLSGVEDLVPLVVPKRMIDASMDYTGMRITVEGTLESRREDNGERKRLALYVFGINVSIYEAYDSYEEDINTIHVSCQVKTGTTIRKTPLKERVIADFYVTTSNGKRTSYIPCLAWDDSVEKLKEFQPNDKMELNGRFQSREYQKEINGEIFNMIAYEISANDFEKIA